MNQDDILRRAAEAAQQVQTPQGVQPAPSPMSVQVAQMGQYVVLVIQHSVGQSVFFFEPEGAEKIADNIKSVARMARTGLALPPNLKLAE